jgi:hypothetical protein
MWVWIWWVLLWCGCFRNGKQHSLTTLTEVFPCFSSVVRQMPGLNSQVGARTTSLKLLLLSFVMWLSLCCAIVFMLFCLLLCCYCIICVVAVIICVVLCIDCVYWTTATGCKPNCSWQIYHIVSFLSRAAIVTVHVKKSSSTHHCMYLNTILAQHLDLQVQTVSTVYSIFIFVKFNYN